MKCPRCGEPEHPDQCTVPAQGGVEYLDHVGAGTPQGSQDWQTVRRILLRVRPNWKPIISSSPTPEDDGNRRDYDLCESILWAYPMRDCSHCKRERYWWNFYRCWDCKAYLCEDCIKSHFGSNHQPHPKLIEQYETEIAKLKASIEKYVARDDARDDHDLLWN